MKLYSLEAINKLADHYINKADGQAIVTEEGTLLDNMLFVAPGLKTVVATVKYLNDSSSAYTVRQYNKTPDKYLKFIN